MLLLSSLLFVLLLACSREAKMKRGEVGPSKQCNRRRVTRFVVCAVFVHLLMFGPVVVIYIYIEFGMFLMFVSAVVLVVAVLCYSSPGVENPASTTINGNRSPGMPKKEAWKRLWFFGTWQCTVSSSRITPKKHFQGKVGKELPKQYPEPLLVGKLDVSNFAFSNTANTLQARNYPK